MSCPVSAPRGTLGVLAALLLLGLGGTGCQKKDASKTLPPGAAPLSLEALKNGDYLTEFDPTGRVRLVNGHYENAPEHLAIQLLSDQIGRGDLDGDGGEDAACLLVTESGGSGSFVDLVAVVNRRGEPESRARQQLGDRIRVNGVRVEERTILVDMITHGPGDPLCCPTLATTRRFRLEGSSLRDVTPGN